MAEGNAITVKIGAETDGIEQGIRNIQQSISKLGSKADEASKGFDMSFGKIGLAAGVAGAAVKVGMMAVEAATAAARAVVDGFGQAIDLGGKLSDLSSRTGETAGNLLTLQRAFDNSGVGADKVGTSINKLQKFMAEAAAGGESQTETLSALGISMSDLAGKTPTEQMQVFAKQIADISDPAQRARAAMEVFGKSGGELLPLLNNFAGEIDAAKGQLGSLPGVMDRSAAAMDTLGDNFAAIKNKTMEFAAGFLEDALPALNAFTTSLTGVDAAGWGQKLMDQVMSVADFLIGAFKAPMPAIEAIGSALETGIRMTGNALLNGFMTAADFLGKYITSELPFTAIKTLSSAMGYIYSSFAKGMIDAIINSAKSIEDFFSKAIKSILDFFSSGFFDFVKGFAQDFANAMSDPIGFFTGKLKSGLEFVTQGSASKFQSAFESAGGSVLDKVSAGLGATADNYKKNLVEGVSTIQDGFGKLVDSIEPSARDFFGAEESAARTKDKFGEVVEVGKKVREDFEKSATSADAANKSTSGAVTDAEAIAGSFDKAAGSAKKAKEELSESAKLFKSIEEARAKDAVDRGGRDTKRAQDAIGKGNFSAAERAANRIAAREERQTRQAAEKETAAAEAAKPLAQRMAEGTQSFRDRFAKKAEETKSAVASVDKPGQTGQTREQARSGDGKPIGKSALESLVEDIKKLIEKIEPKLPTNALMA